VQEIRGISPVFREMWDTTAWDLTTLRSPTTISVRTEPRIAASAPL
jgi:hypothetical protein